MLALNHIEQFYFSDIDQLIVYDLCYGAIHTIYA